MDHKTITLYHELKPAYYDQFHCIMGDCRLSCCTGTWKITFDKKDYMKLRGLKSSPELTDEMNSGMRRVRKGPLSERCYAEFDTSSGACPMLTEEGLCRLQMEHGGDILPLVYRVFPRSEYYSSMALERSLSPACEAVLGLLWDLPEGVDFVLTDLPKPIPRKMLLDTPLGWAFPEVRSLCIDFLQDRALSLPQRMLLMGMALKDLADHPEEPEQWLERAAALLADPKRAELTAPMLRDGDKEIAMRAINNFMILTKVEQQNPVFGRLRGQILTNLGQLSSGGMTIQPALYRTLRQRLEARLTGHEAFFENLMVAVLFHLHFPEPTSPEELWKSYVNLCNLYSVYHFMAVMSCHDEAADETAARAELFRYLTLISRALIHNQAARTKLRDELFQHDSADLAHMAILLGG